MKTHTSTRLLFAAGLCACVIGISPAQAQNVLTAPVTKTWVHSTANGTPDPGVATTDPNTGARTTTYADGWTETTEIDNAYAPPPGGLKRTVYDKDGHIREITRTDGNNQRRYHMILVNDDPVPGTWTKYQEGYDKNGRMNVAEKEEIKGGKSRKADWDFDKGIWKPWGPWGNTSEFPASTAPVEKKS